METTIRLANLEDIPALVRLMQEYYAFDQLNFDEAIAQTALRGLLGNESLGRAWVVCHDNLPVGYAVLTFSHSLEFGGRDAVIDELYLQEVYRGRGIGKKLLGLVETTARTLGLKAIHLEVEYKNKRAQRFYRSVGFEARERFYLMSKCL